MKKCISMIGALLLCVSFFKTGKSEDIQNNITNENKLKEIYPKGSNNLNVNPVIEGNGLSKTDMKIAPLSSPQLNSTETMGAGNDIKDQVGVSSVLPPEEENINSIISTEVIDASIGTKDQIGTVSYTSPQEEKIDSVNNKEVIGVSNTINSQVRPPAFSSSKEEKQTKNNSYSSEQSAQVPKQVSTSTEKQQYENALSIYRRGSYNDAIKSFDTFISNYPSSYLIANALYWKGESLYSQNNYIDAIIVFKSVVANYSKSHKASDALLKMVMCYNKLGDKENASLHYRVLFEDYPNSTAVTTAKKLGIQPLK